MPPTSRPGGRGVIPRIGSSLYTAKHPGRCPNCGGTNLARKGSRRKKFETVQRSEILRLRASDPLRYSMRALARHYHVSPRTIRYVLDPALYERCKVITRRRMRARSHHHSRAKKSHGMLTVTGNELKELTYEEKRPES